MKKIIHFKQKPCLLFIVGCRSPRKQIIYILSKVKLPRYPAQGTGISVVDRENKLFIFYQKLNY